MMKRFHQSPRKNQSDSRVQVPVRACLVSLLLLCFMSAVNAQDSIEELQKHVQKLKSSEELRQEKGTGEALRRVKREGERIERVIEAGKEEARQAPVPTPVPQTHVKVAGGIPFPKPEEVVLEPLPTDTPEPPSKTPPYEGPKYERPRRCEKPKTDRIQFKEKQRGEIETILADTLYLPESYVPVDSSEVFGITTRLNPYGPESGDGVYVSMEIDNVPCVPYRIRITKYAMYIDQGNFALKNYDQKPDGEGKYHTWMQSKLFGVSESPKVKERKLNRR